MNERSQAATSELDVRIARLRRARPRSRFLRASLLLLAIIAAGAWFGGDIQTAGLLDGRRLENAARFADEIRPYPLQGGAPWHWSIAADWARERLTGAGGLHALGTTLAISVAAIVLAGALGGMAALFAARNLVMPNALLSGPRRASWAARTAAATLLVGVRGALIFVRSVPEYIWAFLLIQMFGYTAWPAVLALALHNAGILGKLFAETVEDMEPSRAAALAGLGATRAQITAAAIVPDVLPRCLLYFFYRWETCVREATVLGMLGVLSLGTLVRDARASNFYDEMFFFVMLGAALVMVGDLVSAAARATIRNAA